MSPTAATCLVVVSLGAVIGAMQSNEELKPEYDSCGVLSAHRKIQEVFMGSPMPGVEYTSCKTLTVVESNESDEVALGPATQPDGNTRPPAATLEHPETKPFQPLTKKATSRRRSSWKTGGYADRTLSTGGVPKVCENFEEADENGTVLGKFVCPHGDLPDNYIYCCGPAGKQNCCRFFDDPKRTIGIAMGVHLSICLLLFGFYKILPSQRNKDKKE